MIQRQKSTSLKIVNIFAVAVATVVLEFFAAALFAVVGNSKMPSGLIFLIWAVLIIGAFAVGIFSIIYIVRAINALDKEDATQTQEPANQTSETKK